MNRLKSQLLTVRFLLIPLTVFEIVYFGIALSASELRKSLDADYYTMWWILGYHLIMWVVILWLNWTKFPIPQKLKLNNSILVTFLGILGMWLWMPSSDDIDGLSRMG